MKSRGRGRSRMTWIIGLSEYRNGVHSSIIDRKMIINIDFVVCRLILDITIIISRNILD